MPLRLAATAIEKLAALIETGRQDLIARADSALDALLQLAEDRTQAPAKVVASQPTADLDIDESGGDLAAHQQLHFVLNNSALESKDAFKWSAAQRPAALPARPFSVVGHPPSLNRRPNRHARGGRAKKAPALPRAIR
jgi:hypothetical protein